METISRGNATEAAVMQAFLQRGSAALIPFGDATPFDLAVYRDGAFLRVQCKTGWVRRGCLIFNAYSTDHGRGRGSYAGLAAVFGVLRPDTMEVYVVPVGELGSSKPQLRLEPTLNGQRKRVRYASAYEIDSWESEELLQRVAGRVAA